MKNLFILLMLFLCSCATVKQPNYIKQSLEFSIKSEINKSVLDGFFDNDTTKITDSTLFLK